jgi:signal transduction histidine kinase/ligand-binding sensor domain-containing protein
MNVRSAIIGAMILLWSSRASALDPVLDVAQYAHTVWRIGEGLLNSRVVSIAQTPDGYLWLGTESGLLRFDGVRSVPWPAREYGALPSTDIVRLLVTRDGRLWIGTSAGLVSWKDHRLVAYPELAGQIIGTLIEDSKGTVWAGTLAIPNARLCAIRATVECEGQDGRLGNGVFSMFEEGGTLWVGAQTGLWRWSPGLPTRYTMPTPSVNDLLKGSDGTLLIAMQAGVRQIIGHAQAAYAIPGVEGALEARRFLVDRHRALWIGTANRGLVHVREGRADLFGRVDGLSGDLVHALFEDREGNVWVATNDGLDRFREPAVATISTKQGLSADGATSVLQARDGSVWLGTPNGVTRWKDGRPTIYRAEQGLPDRHIGTVFEDSAGRILVSSLAGIAAFDGRKFVPLPSAFTRVVYNIVEPRPGELWISDHHRGLLRLIGDEVAQTIPWSALGRDDHANALVVDEARDGLWMGFYKGDVAFVQDGAIRRAFRTADGLGAGRVSHLRFDQDGALWAATAGGLSRIKDDRVATLTTANGMPCDAVHWTIADANRSLWLFTACGLVRIGAPELAAWNADPRHPVKSTVFGSADGVRIHATAIGFNPPAARLPDGRLWFASTSGIGAVDPGRLPFNALPPGVHIEQVVADRTAVDPAMTPDGIVRLPPRVRDLQVDYTATSLVAPERMRFRYILEGNDREWQDVGTRRQAFYTDLKPGAYRFRVTAANDSGVWNDAGASVQFTIAPAYYQTRWFLALSLGTLATLIWSVYRVRSRVVEKHRYEITALNERLMKAQEQERIRIAGELHDGVMQQMLAMTMMLGTAKRRIADDSEARPTLDKISDKLVEVGSEIRRMSHDLHPPILQEAGLSEAVRAYCDEFSASSGIPVVCGAGDGLDALSRGAALALFRIMQEALGNAAKHAHAARISVQLMRSGDVVTLSISDDGAGFDRSRLSASGGLGLIMMRERAGQLNGTFEFNSAAGRGTSIKVTIPFR